MADTPRMRRVSDRIKQIVASMLESRIKDPRLGFVTVTDVRAAVDNCYLVGLQTSLDRLEPSLAGRPEPWDWDAFAVGRAHYAGLGLAAPVAVS